MSRKKLLQDEAKELGLSMGIEAGLGSIISNYKEKKHEFHRKEKIENPEITKIRSKIIGILRLEDTAKDMGMVVTKGQIANKIIDDVIFPKAEGDAG